jgi:hypothetical protein
MHEPDQSVSSIGLPPGDGFVRPSPTARDRLTSARICTDHEQAVDERAIGLPRV